MKLAGSVIVNTWRACCSEGIEQYLKINNADALTYNPFCERTSVISESGIAESERIRCWVWDKWECDKLKWEK